MPWTFRSNRGGRSAPIAAAMALALGCMGWEGACAQAAAGPAPTVQIDPDGSVHAPAMVVPPSSFLSPEGKAYLSQHLHDMQDPARVGQVDGVPIFMQGYLARQKVLFPVQRRDTTIAGVHAYIYTPRAGVAARNKRRVLINLHGGGFSGCFPGCAELESMPVAALGRTEVISLDYREGPKYRFPAATSWLAAGKRYFGPSR